MLADVFRYPFPSTVSLARGCMALSLWLLAGCHRDGAAPETHDAQGSVAAQGRKLNNQVRLELQQIPAPTKSKYMAIKSLSTWQNPYLTVQDTLIVLHVTLADANTSGLGQGGMLRPSGARRQDLTIRITELPSALNAVPASAWPLGRVIAVEEAHNTPAAKEPAVRRTIEGVMQTLGDLGVVPYEWNEGGAGLR